MNYGFFRAHSAHFSWQKNKWNTRKYNNNNKKNNPSNNNNKKNRPFSCCWNLLLLLAASLLHHRSTCSTAALLFHSLHLIYISSCALFFFSSLVQFFVVVSWCMCTYIPSSLWVLSNFFPVLFSRILFSFRSFDINYTFCRNSSLCPLSLLTYIKPDQIQPKE